ncbi:DUF5682 family protein [Psychrobacter sp. I-STPA10]|uniref:DUF5682 family protein n=1 Tax=Psychrobacter sp. I-STPA10 TaxID=2585769 RepID=UPI001E4E0B7D|nr:DUF5682 family protein [Psychrobacter sp. I-STPA10]
MATQTPDIHYLGIRHHGPGSTSRLLKALNELQPDCVLIEGPSDCSELLPLLADKQMRPPVALLAYAADSPEQHLYYPFTEYSPEYQACLWAVKQQATLAFIDLPINIQLAARLQRQQQLEEAMAKLEADGQSEDSKTVDAELLLDETQLEEEPVEQSADDSDLTDETDHSNGADNTDSLDNVDSPEAINISGKRISNDPIGVLAKLAGYQDGESWWNDFIEQNHNESEDSQALFASIAEVMAVLRASSQNDKLIVDGVDADGVAVDIESRDDVREAYMRLQIVDYSKQLIKQTNSSDNTNNKNTKPPVIAVVCGAWHVPALQTGSTQKADKQLLKDLPKKLTASKVKTTWIPWTSARLSKASGYGAGVAAPMWYQHLWDYRHHPDQLTYWIRHIANSLREQGQIISTASVIETVRLSHSLASVHGRPAVGFEEIIDATISCLCFGEPLIWQQIATTVLQGNRVGQIPDNMPLAPLLEDLQRQQKLTKLKPEALGDTLSLDLRSDSGNKRSVLLHRLQILNVPWGTLLSSGSSRGTFRENWQLQWQPEYAVQLVENLVYGNSIEQASNNKLIEVMGGDLPLDKLATQVQLSLTAQLDDAVQMGLKRLNQQAAHNSDALSLLGAIVPLVQISRYGTARHIDFAQVGQLITQLVTQAALALPYACRNLNEDEANHFRERLKATHSSILLAQLSEDLMQLWWQALEQISHSTETSPLLSGLSTRLLYQAEQLERDELQRRLKRTLSPAIASSDAAAYFDGFFSEAVQQLQYDTDLLTTLEQWLMSLADDAFVQYLPLFKRVFADLDRTERQHLLQKILGKQYQASILYHSHVDLLPLWQQQQQALARLLMGQAIVEPEFELMEQDTVEELK